MLFITRGVRAGKFLARALKYVPRALRAGARFEKFQRARFARAFLARDFNHFGLHITIFVYIKILGASLNYALKRNYN